MANWEELTQEILELIARRLGIEDFLAVRGVCTSWRSAAAKETYNVKSKAPWLRINVRNPTAEFFSPSRGRTYRVRFPEYRFETLSPRGWILVSKCGREYRIFNPLSHVSIGLPALEKLCHESRLSGGLDGLERLWCSPPRIDTIALSSSPSLSRSYTVMISFHQGHGPRGFAFHRSGEDGWTVVSPPTHQPRSIVLQLIYYDGLFVALDGHKQIITFNERKRPVESRLVLRLNCFEGYPYLVECSGSLLVASTIRNNGYGPVGKIRVFEVDLEKETQEEVRSLRNASLFLNDNSSFSVEFNVESCLPGIKPNHVYFPEYENEKIKSYSMEDGKFDATSSLIFDAQWFQPDFLT